jgi:hypothetical protein
VIQSTILTKIVHKPSSKNPIFNIKKSLSHKILTSLSLAWACVTNLFTCSQRTSLLTSQTFCSAYLNSVDSATVPTSAS